jgi:hypothetical protein
MATGHAETRANTGLSSAVETTAWVGWLFFAALMMITLGTFHAIAGFVALFKDDYFLVGPNELLVNVDYTGWGWTHIILGALAIVAGFGLMVGKMWARVFAILLAILSAVVNLAFISAYPIWSTLVIALDVIVIYAIAVHGSEAKEFAGS